MLLCECPVCGKSLLVEDLTIGYAGEKNHPEWPTQGQVWCPTCERDYLFALKIVGIAAR